MRHGNCKILDEKKGEQQSNCIKNPLQMDKMFLFSTVFANISENMWSLFFSRIMSLMDDRKIISLIVSSHKRQHYY